MATAGAEHLQAR